MLFLLIVLLVAFPPKVELRVEEQKMLTIGPATTATTDAPSVVELKRIKPEVLLLIGRSEGTARLRLVEPDGSRSSWVVEVRPFDAQVLLRKGRALVANHPEVIVWVEGHCLRLACASCSQAAQSQMEEANVLLGCLRSVHQWGVRRQPNEVLAGVRALLGEGPDDTPGLVLHLVDGRVVLTGEAHSPEDQRRVEAVRRLFPEVGLGVTARP